MCKKQVTPNDCYNYLKIVESSIQHLYNSIDNFLFQDINMSIVRGMLPQWVLDAGRTPELTISKETYEKFKHIYDKPIVRKFIYYYDLWNIIAALQDRLEAVDMFMRNFYENIPFELKHKEEEYTSGCRVSGKKETETHINLNGLFIALASTFDLLSKIAIEQAQYDKYGDFSEYSSMKSSGNGLYNINKLKHIIHPLLIDENMLFTKNKNIRMIETFRNEYVHNGPWDLRCSVYYTCINDEPADVIVYAPDIDEYGNFISSGARNKFYSQNNKMNSILPELVESILVRLKNTIDCLTNLYKNNTTQTPDKTKTEQCLNDIAECLKNILDTNQEE